MSNPKSYLVGPHGAGVQFAREVAPLYGKQGTTEASYYPSIKELWGKVLENRGLPFEVRVATAEPRDSGGSDFPDVALYDAGDYPTVYAEVKLPEVKFREIAFSTARNDQVGRYLARTGVVLVTNVRAVGLVACKPEYRRKPGTPVPPDQRQVLEEVELWPSLEAFEEARSIDPDRLRELAELIEEAVTQFAPIADPSSLARILARQARRAKADLPSEIKTVELLLKDYSTALGLTFTSEEGEEFLRSSLIQTAYYGLFAGWALWYRANDGTSFEWERLDRYLRIPFLGQLFWEFRHPDRLAELRLAPHLDRASETLGRVDREHFFSRFHAPTLEDEGDEGHTGALVYFYEPFLEAFDPELRKELGVWYTPPEVVRYQVRRVDQLLRDELGCASGFADERVVVLDPCCGTGAYLLEVMRCIAAEIRSRGDDALLGTLLQKAVVERILGFEILTAPFVIVQLQLYLMLAELGAEPTPPRRPAVFLTNALTDWSGEEQVTLNFPELQREHDLAQKVKREARIIVILGNPPYNRFAGAALDEEADLVDHYKGIERVEKKNRRGQVQRDKDGNPILVQKGETRLYAEWGIRKQLLDDLYVRFFRLAERQIGEKAEYGVVSFISNSSYLTGRSHPIMRESLLRSFHAIWIDNLNGDKYRTGKVIPEGVPGSGTADQSIFTTSHDSRGIQVGTCIGTLLKRKEEPAPAAETRIHYREFWGRADSKRRALLESLKMDDWSKAARDRCAERPEGPRAFESFRTTAEKGWRLRPSGDNAGYEAWPALDELFPVRFQGVNPNRGLDGSVIDTSRKDLTARMRGYFNAESFEEVQEVAPALAVDRARYDPKEVWEEARSRSQFDENAIVPYLLFPLDSRWLYYQSTTKLINEKRPEFWSHLGSNEFVVAAPSARQLSETRPFLSETLVDLHAHDRGSVCIPRETFRGDLLSARLANLDKSTWNRLREEFRYSGDLEGEDAKECVRKLFRSAIALLHSPEFEEDHREALAHDWARIPIPKQLGVLARAADLGDKVACLLDPVAETEGVLQEVVGDRLRTLGALKSKSKKIDLRVTISYFGAARGRWVERDYRDEEDPLSAWGERTGDLYLNDETWLSNVPERVWRYELGGYPVIRKWLGYRSTKRRDGKPLTVEEAQHLRSIAQRIAALLTLHPELDEAYRAAAAEAFTTEELGLRG